MWVTSTTIDDTNDRLFNTAEKADCKTDYGKGISAQNLYHQLPSAS